MMPRKLSFFLEITSRPIRVYLWCAFASYSIVVIIRKMNTQRNVAQTLEEEIGNAGSPPTVINFLHLKKSANMEQASVNPPPFTDGDISHALIKLAEAAIVQAQAITTHENQEVVPVLINKLLLWLPV